MPDTVLESGIATAIGSLPHHDATAAAALVLRCIPELPAAPQLPMRTPLEGVVAQWARAIAGVEVAADGSLSQRPGLARLDARAAVDPVFDPIAHGGLLTFLDVAAAQPVPPRRVKVQCAGPLTLGVALVEIGVAPDTAFALGARAARAWAIALEALVAERLPKATLVLCFDEPALVRWQASTAPLDRETATDILSTALAAPTCLTAVHVCGRGDLRLALDAGPRLIHFDIDTLDLDDAVTLSRFLDGGGWVMWGAIPTHRPVGEQAAPLWKSLLGVWCELTRRGCDPARLRSQALVAPACGLAGHGVSQAERAMLLAREIGGRVHDHGAATKLAIGA
jgi:Cobalamin-independent synthase, Catalytic domain